MKKKTKRSKHKYPGLVKNLNIKNRQEFLDQDYIDKLSDKEKQWLSNFNEEFISANFKHKGKLLHKSKAMKRDCYNRNNARNRDVYGKAKINDMLKDINSSQAVIENQNLRSASEVENDIIELLDNFKKDQET